MKRFALAILLVTVVAATAFVVLNRPGAEASTGATITVNTWLDDNSRDDRLSLREAMMLATGDLWFILLSEEECAQVSTLAWSVTFCAIGTGNPPGADYADTIEFASLVFPTAYITLGSDLPPLDEGDDTIDASSSSTTWVVDCDDPLMSGFEMISNNNTIKGLEIYDCGVGVFVYEVNAQNNTIGGSGPGEGNVISGNGVGVAIATGAQGNVVKGNYIGTDASGTVAVPNNTGVSIHNVAQDNTVGGSGPGEGNVISGNNGTGVEITHYGTDGNVVKGNYIGTDASGTVAVPNDDGVEITDGAQDNTVGGSNPGEGNVISGHFDTHVSNDTGVLISGSGTNGNVVKGNYIGSDASGTVAVPNNCGVCIGGGAQDNTVGGSGPGEGNVISGNDFGVEIEDSGTNGNVVKGNYIGTGASGTVAVPNDRGVSVYKGAQNNIIGGSGPGEGNVISGNHFGVGIWGSGTNGNTIRGNSIHSNGGEGIALSDGGNNELAAPTVESAGSVLGTACPDCTIDVYSDDEDEGRVYEGSTTAEGDGNWSFPGWPEGPNATATATDSDGNTSEFSAPVTVPEPPPTPTPTPVSDSDGDTVADDVEEAFGSDPDDPDSTPEHAAMPSTCSDGVDNDGDGMTDAEDEGCRATRTLVWGPGWHNVTWTGTSTPDEAFACAAGNYAAAYRLVGGGWERHFPDRPDLSNMTDLAQYEAFLILATGDVTCEMPVADPPGTERTLDWSVGWQNDGWTGADGSAPEDVFDCADGSYAAAYRLVGGGWERHFPDRPDISNMGPLDGYDAFLILVTAPVSCSMAVGP